MNAFLAGCKVVVRDPDARTADAICLECGERWDVGRYSIQNNDDGTMTLRLCLPLDGNGVLARHADTCATGKAVSAMVVAGENR